MLPNQALCLQFPVMVNCYLFHFLKPSAANSQLAEEVPSPLRAAFVLGSGLLFLHRPRNTVINAHAPCPGQKARPVDAPRQVPLLAAVPAPLTASPAAARPDAAASSRASPRPACLPPAPWDRAGCVHYSSLTVAHRVGCRAQFQQRDL